MSEHPQNTYFFDGIKVLNTWIKTSDVAKYRPISQVYGVVFDQKNEILICRKSDQHDWNLPGGHPLKNESFEDTLKRELLEEADATVINIRPLGVQKAEFPDNAEHKTVYQMRCIADLKELLPQTPDPDNGMIWERRFVPIDRITEFIDWSETGKAMFADAVEVHK